MILVRPPNQLMKARLLSTSSQSIHSETDFDHTSKNQTDFDHKTKTQSIAMPSLSAFLIKTRPWHQQHSISSWVLQVEIDFDIYWHIQIPNLSIRHRSKKHSISKTHSSFEQSTHRNLRYQEVQPKQFSTLVFNQI